MNSEEFRMMPIGALKSASKRSLVGGPFGSKLGRQDYVDSGVPVIRGGNLPSGQVFSFDDFVFVSEAKADELSSNLAYPGDVVVTQRGTLGQVGLIPADSPFSRFVISQSQMKLTVDESIASARYVYYALSAPNSVERLLNHALVAGVPHINLGIFSEFEIPVPSLETQVKIAAMLSHYDELIENNARRIGILEEMAQTIYREWFVEFRYPGHEDVPLVDSELGPIPEGWGVTTVDSAFEISGGGTPSKTVTEYWDDGDIDWYTPTDLTATRSMFMSGSKSKITKLGLAKSSAKLFPAGSVMMTSRATIGVVSISETEASTNQGFITCIPNDRYSAYFIVQWLRASADVIDSLASGATFKEINKKNFREIKIVAPSEIALTQFQELVAPICDSIAVLLKSNRNLRETRDLLLPRLISGEIDVSELDIELADASV
jgi:type I restriction enzyme S subunit